MTWKVQGHVMGRVFREVLLLIHSASCVFSARECTCRSPRPVRNQGNVPKKNWGMVMASPLSRRETFGSSVGRPF